MTDTTPADQAPEAPSAPNEDVILQRLLDGATVEESISAEWEAPVEEAEAEPAADGVQEAPGPGSAEPAAEAAGTPQLEQARGTPVDPGELERALNALRRDSYPQAYIETLADADVVALGLKRAKVQGDQDRVYTRQSELEKKIAELEAGTESVAEPGQAEPAGQPANVDLTALLTPFEDLLGDEGKTAISNLSTALQRQAQDLVTQATAPLVEQIKAMSAAYYENQEAAARTQLAGDFPGLADPGVYARVRDKMAKMAATGDYEDMKSLMSDAARIELFNAQPAPTVPSKAKTNGSPVGPGTRKVHTRDEPVDDPEWETFKLLQDGKRDEAFRLNQR